MLEKDTNEYVGNIEIIIKDNNIGEIMMSIVSDKQNKHYGTESLTAVMEYGKKQFNIDKYELFVYANNKRAIHCYEKVGFVQEGDGLTDDDIHMIYKMKEGE